MKTTFTKSIATWVVRSATLLSLLSSNIHAAQIAAWDLTGNNTATATVAATVFDANLDSANTITRGSGAAASAANNSFRTTGFQNNGISTANNDYFQVTLSAAPGFLLSLSTIDARFAGTATFAASPGVSAQFAYSLDGINFTLIGSPFVLVGTPATLSQISLVGISALQNVPEGTTITIRYYASGQTTTGGWGFNSPSAGSYGLDFGGSISSLGLEPLMELQAKRSWPLHLLVLPLPGGQAEPPSSERVSDGILLGRRDGSG